MSEPSEPRPPVDLGKASASTDRSVALPTADVPFDPYRYGRPEHPVPPEYAPPGYLHDPAQPNAGPPYGAPPNRPNAYQQLPVPTQYAGSSYSGQAPPGAPMPPAYHGYRQPGTGNGKAIAALVLGIAAVLLCWLSIIDAVPVTLAIVFGSLALGDAKRGAGGRGMAVAGIVLAIVGGLLATILTVAIFRAIDRCGGMSHPQTSNTEFGQCVTDNF